MQDMGLVMTSLLSDVADQDTSRQTAGLREWGQPEEREDLRTRPRDREREEVEGLGERRRMKKEEVQAKQTMRLRAQS